MYERHASKQSRFWFIIMIFYNWFYIIFDYIKIFWSKIFLYIFWSKLILYKFLSNRRFWLRNYNIWFAHLEESDVKEGTTSDALQAPRNEGRGGGVAETADPHPNTHPQGGSDAEKHVAHNYLKQVQDIAIKGTYYHINYPIFAYFRLLFFYPQDEAVCA